MKKWTSVVVVLLLLGGMACSGQKNDANSVSSTTPVLNGSAVIAGVVSGSQYCAGTASVTLTSSMGGAAVYPSTQVPVGGNFEFHVQPGAYSLVAQNSTGCGAYQQVSATANQVSQVNASLSPGMNGGGGYTGGGYTGGGTYNPCPWGTWGCGGGYYPGHGGGMAGKPNVYFSGPEGTVVSVKLNFKDGNNLLAASPVHAQGWSGKLNKEGMIAVGQATYEYLFYDARVDVEKFRSDKGACFPHSQVLNQMLSYLNTSGFKAREVKDFQEYWAKRIPSASGYCIFVLEDVDLDSAVTLDVQPKPESIKRVWFFLSPQSDAQVALMKGASKFIKSPAEKFVFARPAVSSERGIASQSVGLQVREWGVGFFVEGSK